MSILSDKVRPPYLERMILGAMIALAGVLMLLDWAGVIGSTRGGWSLWPLILIGLGISRLFPSETGHRRRHGGFLVFAGVWLLASQVRLLRFQEFWPLVLIGAGLFIVWTAMDRPAPPDGGMEPRGR